MLFISYFLAFILNCLLEVNAMQLKKLNKTNRKYAVETLGFCHMCNCIKAGTTQKSINSAGGQTRDHK